MSAARPSGKAVALIAAKIAFSVALMSILIARIPLSSVAESLRVPGGPLPFQRGGIGDHSAAMTGAAMISAALVGRAGTGEGRLVSTSLLRQGAYTIGFDVNVALMWGRTLATNVREAMEQLSESDRQILELFANEQLSYDQIAARMGIGLKAVGPRLTRARQRLKEQLSPEALG